MKPEAIVAAGTLYCSFVEDHRSRMPDTRHRSAEPSSLEKPKKPPSGVRCSERESYLALVVS